MSCGNYEVLKSTINDKNCQKALASYLAERNHDLTLKEIAAKMNLSPRTIDGYRDNLFEKVKVSNRVGLVLFALRNNLIQL